MSWSDVVALVYAGGVSVLLCGVVLGWWQGRRIVREARLVRGRLTHARCVAPMTVGVWRPVVILPADWVTWDDGDLAAVVAHEEEHVRRHDTLVMLLALVNRAVFWFHPLAWWLRRRIATLSEQACDAVVVTGGHDAERYASVLVHFARAASSAGAGSLPAVGMSAVGLRRRLDLLFSPSEATSRPRGVLARTRVSGCSRARARTATPSRAQTQDVAAWHTHTTNHFQIHYAPALRSTWVEDVAGMAEQAYARLATGLRYELVQRVSLVLVQRTGEIPATPRRPSRTCISAAASASSASSCRSKTSTRAPTRSSTSSRISSRSRIAPQASRLAPWLMEGLAEHRARDLGRAQGGADPNAVRTSGVPNPESAHRRRRALGARALRLHRVAGGRRGDPPSAVRDAPGCEAGSRHQAGAGHRARRVRERVCRLHVDSIRSALKRLLRDMRGAFRRDGGGRRDSDVRPAPGRRS